MIGIVRLAVALLVLMGVMLSKTDDDLLSHGFIEEPSLELLSAADLNKWSITCNARQNGDGVRLAQGVASMIGTMSTKTALNAANNADFQFEVRITGNTSQNGLADGYAIYIVRNSSLDTKYCCADCPQAHFDVIKNPGPALGIRLHWNQIPGFTVNMFPRENVTYTNASFSWPWINSLNRPPYGLGNCKVTDYRDITTIARFMNGNLTVEMKAMVNGNLTTTKCADNVPIPGLVEVINRGDAVLAISGGTGDVRYFIDPVVRYVRFYSIRPASTTTASTTTTAEGTSPTTEMTASTTNTGSVLSTSTESGQTAGETTMSLIDASFNHSLQPSTTDFSSNPGFVSPETSNTTQLMPVKVPRKTWKLGSVVANQDSELQAFYENFTSTPDSSPRWTVPGLLMSCDYHFSPDLTAPPNDGEANAVNGVFFVDRVVDFDNLRETVTVSGAMFQQWNVTTCYKLKADLPPSSMNEKVFLTSPNEVWVPPYLFTTASSDIYMQSASFGTDLIAAVTQSPEDDHKKLAFYYVRRGFFSANCPLDLAKFPFDQQACNFSFTLKESIESVYFSNVAMYCPQEELTEWRFTKCEYLVSKMTFQGSQVETVNFRIHLTRKSYYYVVNLVLPNLALSILELAGFLMPPHMPDRPIFGVTILLALTVAQSQVLQGVPQTSQPILLADYILMLTACAALTTLYHLFISFWAAEKKGEQKEKMPSRFCLKKTRRFDGLAFLAMVALFASTHVYAIGVAFF